MDVGGDGFKLFLGDVCFGVGLVVFDFFDNVGGLGELGCEIITYFRQGDVEKVFFIEDLFSDGAREVIGELFHVGLEGLA